MADDVAAVVEETLAEMEEDDPDVEEGGGIPAGHW